MAKKSFPTNKSSALPLKEKDRIYLDTLTSEYLKELITFCRVAKQGYALCICNVPKFREDLISTLNEKLKPDGIGVYQLRLSTEDLSLGRKIRILLESKEFVQFEKLHPKVVLSITGLDDTIQDDEKDFKKRPIALQGINQQRDYLRTLPFSFDNLDPGVVSR